MPRHDRTFQETIRLVKDYLSQGASNFIIKAALNLKDSTLKQYKVLARRQLREDVLSGKTERLKGMLSAKDFFLSKEMASDGMTPQQIAYDLMLPQTKETHQEIILARSCRDYSFYMSVERN